MKRSEEIVEILEAYDLTGSCRAAAELAGCDHHSVARSVLLREAGQPPVAREHRARPIDDCLDEVEELVARSNGRVVPMSCVSGWSRWASPVGGAPPAARSRR